MSGESRETMIRIADGYHRMAQQMKGAAETLALLRTVEKVDSKPAT
jgi:hypothetical protein